MGILWLTVNKKVVPEFRNHPKEVIQSTYFSFQNIIWHPIPYLKIISKKRRNAAEEKDDDFMDTEAMFSRREKRKILKSVVYKWNLEYKTNYVLSMSTAKRRAVQKAFTEPVWTPSSSCQVFFKL